LLFFNPTKNVIEMKNNFIPLEYTFLSEQEMLERSAEFYNSIKKRRTIRDFSNREIPLEIVKNALRSAGTAPNGANMQPWHFVVVTNKDIKHKIRIAAEEEEREFYNSKAPQEWLDDLSPLGTDASKPFLEYAPVLIAVFEKKFGINELGEKKKYYYTKESVGIACGILITALHRSGLATLTHTPSPMNFLNEILNRPANEKPFLLLVVGYPKENTMVPNISKKSLTEIADFI
jgi:nitroreductase